MREVASTTATSVPASEEVSARPPLTVAAVNGPAAVASGSTPSTLKRTTAEAEPLESPATALAALTAAAPRPLAARSARRPQRCRTGAASRTPADSKC
jgi:hypothetical protein